jgi:hypothetical protein
LAPGPKLRTVLDVLEKRGDHQKAAARKRQVLEQFSRIAAEKELLAMHIDDIVGVLDLYRIFVSELSKTKKPVLESHIGDLVQRGFTVVYGPNMPDIVTKS